MQNFPAHGELRNEMGKLILGGHFHFYDYKDSRQPRPRTHTEALGTCGTGYSIGFQLANFLIQTPNN
jgi:hypothetical protein